MIDNKKKKKEEKRKRKGINICSTDSSILTRTVHDDDDEK
jgi:hypothetical protein